MTDLCIGAAIGVIVTLVMVAIWLEQDTRKKGG